MHTPQSKIKAHLIGRGGRLRVANRRPVAYVSANTAESAHIRSLFSSADPTPTLSARCPNVSARAYALSRQ
eukprot:1195007-Prorocentrum_minimum.AAC.2